MSLHSSLNSLSSIDENKTIDDFNDFIFTKPMTPSNYSNNFFSEKRKSEPAIRFSFYNKLFDMDGRTPPSQRLLSPPRDYRKYSLPLSMSSSHPECPISSLMSPNSSMKYAIDVPTWRSFNSNSHKAKSTHNDLKFKLTISDEDGHEIMNSSSSSMDDCDTNDVENCLFYQENSMKRKNQFENNFIDDEEKICHKCGHTKFKK